MFCKRAHTEKEICHNTYLQEDQMLEMTIDIPIRRLAHLINSMNKHEIETLSMFLTEDGSELLKRNKDLELNRVKYLSEDEVFDV